MVEELPDSNSCVYCYASSEEDLVEITERGFTALFEYCESLNNTNLNNYLEECHKTTTSLYLHRYCQKAVHRALRKRKKEEVNEETDDEQVRKIQRLQRKTFLWDRVPVLWRQVHR